jgi:hypothetical protein
MDKAWRSFEEQDAHGSTWSGEGFTGVGPKGAVMGDWLGVR